MASKDSNGRKYFFIGIAVISAMIFLGLLFGFVGFIALIASGGSMQQGTGNVAVIPINGVISTVGGGGLLGEIGTPSQVIVDWIEDANEDPLVEAIILEIDSPGGTPVASDEIAQAVKESEKPVVAVIREVGASGAYWVASASDHIIANRMSITGSIGVRASGLEFGGFLQDHNITYRRTVAGRYKDIGTPYRESTPEERQILQSTVDAMHEIFIDEVAQNRDLPKSKVRELATGYIFLGIEAKRLNLVDELGGMDEALSYIEASQNITAEPFWYTEPLTFFDLFTAQSTSLAYAAGTGIGDRMSAGLVPGDMTPVMTI